MAKKIPDNLFDKVARGKQSSDAGRTGVGRASDAGRTLKRYSIRLDPADWAALEQHFSERGLTATTGLRMIVRDYLRRHGA